ncbi:MAG: hypothetical protein KF812_04650 [Fimbriimonadaceae bacterium]|nr:hypothetical protein [Fimbriimonadaceae bacterium]
MVTAALAFILALSPQDANPPTPKPWTLQSTGTLAWAGTEYAPVGARIPGTASAIRESHAAGVPSVLIELPATGEGWSEALAALRETGQLFAVAITTPAPTAEVVLVEPDAYRQEEIQNGQSISFPVANGRDALIVVAAKNGGRRTEVRRVPVAGGRVNFAPQTHLTLPHVLIAYPVAESEGTLDLFDGLDSHRDTLLRTIKANDLGPNFRGLVNPMGEMPKVNAPRTAIPVSPLFRTEFAAFLRQKYGSVQTLLKAWQVSASTYSRIDEAASLVPLWANGKGVDAAWDPRTDQVYNVDAASSAMWSDIREMMTIAAVRRMGRLADSIRGATNGAPVILDFDGMEGVSGRELALTDGIGAKGVIEGAHLLGRQFGAAAGAAFRRQTPAWFVGTDMTLAPDADKFSLIERLETMGMRAIFLRPTSTLSLQDIALLDFDREGLKLAPRFLPFPLEAQDPAEAGELPGMTWWLPAPVGGKRLRLGPQFNGYTLDDGNYRTVLWSTTEPKPVKLIANEPANLKITTPDGQPVEVKVVRRGVEFTLPIFPVIIQGAAEPVVPAQSFEAASSAANIMLKQYAELSDPDGRDKVMFAQTIESFDRSPGLATQEMWTILDRLMKRGAPYIWMGATQITGLRMGGVVQRNGATSENVLRFAGRMGDAQAPGEADYRVTPRIAGGHEIWVALSGPASARESLVVQFGELTLTPEDGPVSFYGSSFGWYRVGTINLVPGEHQITVRIKPQLGDEILLDALVLSPLPFRPDGPRPPLSWMDDQIASTP